MSDPANHRMQEHPGTSTPSRGTSEDGLDERDQLRARRRRRLGVDIGTSITDFDGYLLRERPGSEVPVGPVAAALLSEGFPSRDIALLKAVEQLGIMTSEQLARSFFNSPRSAYNRLLLLAERRFLVRLGVDAAMVRSAVGHDVSHQGADNEFPRKNPAYILDWNGYYLLAVHHSYPVRNWRPATAAVITSRFGHTLGISEVWSYIVAAARATQDLDHAAVDPWRYRLSVGFLDERQSLLTAKKASALATAAATAAGTAAVSGAFGSLSIAYDPDWSATMNTGKVLLQPDALLTVAIRQLRAARKQEGGGATSGNESSHLPRPTNPRWNPTLESWQPALMPGTPHPQVMSAGENPGDLIYRSLLLEMETGSNNRKDSTAKVGLYNRLIRTNDAAWTGAYGNAPRVLVVVRTDNQLDPQAAIWRAGYSIHAETAVLLASLQTLARVYKGGRSALIDEPCWYDIMAPPQSAWKTLSEALRIKSAEDRLRS
jgi:Replication-relaxation